MTERARFRYDGTVTLGNLLTAVGVGAAVLIWGIRLEGRVDHEVETRVGMGAQIAGQITETKSTQAANSQLLQAQIASSEERTTRVLTRIDNNLTTLMMERRDGPLPRGNTR